MYNQRCSDAHSLSLLWMVLVCTCLCHFFLLDVFFFLFFLSVPICVMLGKKNYKKNSFFFRVYFSGSGLVIRPRCTERPHDSDSLTHVFFFFHLFSLAVLLLS